MSKSKNNLPLETLKHHVSGAIERGEAQAIEAHIKGKCLWFSDRDGNGIVVDAQGNEYYSDISAIIDRKPLRRNEEVIFKVNYKITDCLCAVVIKRGVLK